MGVLFFLFFILIAWLVGLVINIVSALFIHLIKTLPYFFHGKNAGFRHSWIAFVPAGRQYIAMTIPHCEYNLGLIKTNSRKTVYWVWFGIETLLTIFSGLISIALMFILFYFTDYAIVSDYSSTGDYTAFYDVGLSIFQIVMYGMNILRYIIRSIIQWRMNYDLLKAYDMKEHAMWASIVNIFCPLVMLIFAYILMARSPEYGSDGYYPLEEDSYDDYEDDYEEDSYNIY